MGTAHAQAGFVGTHTMVMTGPQIDAIFGVSG
jgi:hypothetical protein